MPRTIEQYEEIRENRRRHIMDTALELIAKEGYQNVSISKIADRAGISKGLMYNYFESKEDLILSILNKGIDEMFTYFDPDHDGVLTDEEFVYFIRQSFRIIQEKQTFYRLYFSLIVQPQVYEIIKPRVEALYEHIMKILVSYYERKNVPDPHSEALIFGALLDGIGFNYIWNPDMFPVEKITELLISKFSYNHDKTND
jgi:AcrR family transcriptional regulator